jgi:hypothetical protein
VFLLGDWREAHRQELLEKQRHISQKLAQLREFRALMLKWRRIMRNYRDGLKGLDSTVEGSAGFSLQALIRMNTITAQLNQLVGEFEQIGDPKTTGTGTFSSGGTAAGTSGTGLGPGQMTDQQRAAATAELLTARAGPLATMAPWELAWFIDPETSESVRLGEYGPAIANVVLNPYTSLAGMGFAKEIAKQSQALYEEHPEEFAALKKGWSDTKKAVDGISNALDRDFNRKHMQELEENLEGVLRDYESAYDGARGADGKSARQLRQGAAGK